MTIRKRDFLKAVGGLGAATMLGQEGLTKWRPSTNCSRARRSCPGIQRRAIFHRRLQLQAPAQQKVIELWEANQPIYYTGAGQGLASIPMCRASEWLAPIRTQSRWISNMELWISRNYVNSCAASGTVGRHAAATPRHACLSPRHIGLDEAYARANTWTTTQFLDCGCPRRPYLPCP